MWSPHAPATLCDFLTQSGFILNMSTDISPYLLYSYLVVGTVEAMPIWLVLALEIGHPPSRTQRCTRAAHIGTFVHTV
jgi:hypothetical protein